MSKQPAPPESDQYPWKHWREHKQAFVRALLGKAKRSHELHNIVFIFY